MPPKKAMSRAARAPWRRTTNFWWCDPPVRTRMSSRHRPPASLISSPSRRFSAAENARQSQWERQTSPRTSTPRRAAAANTFPTPVSGEPVRRSSGSPRQSTNISRSPSRICDTRRCSSAKYVAPWMRGRTMLPSVQAAPPRWRASSRDEGFPRSVEVRTHRVRSPRVVGTFDPYPAPAGCRGSASGFHLSKASLAFSPACLRLLLVWSVLPSRSIFLSPVALPACSLAAPLVSSLLFFSLSSQPISGPPSLSVVVLRYLDSTARSCLYCEILPWAAGRSHDGVAGDVRVTDIGLRTDPEAPASRAAPSDPPSKTRADSCSSHYWRSRCGNLNTTDLNTTDLNTTDLGQGHDVPLIGSESVVRRIHLRR